MRHKTLLLQLSSSAVLNLWVASSDPRGGRLTIYRGSAGTFRNL